jgi:hypothetical protein
MSHNNFQILPESAELAGGLPTADAPKRGVSRLLRALAALFSQPQAPTPLEAARAARKAAAEAYADAVNREDSRDQHWTLKRYQRATRELMHQERLAGLR